MVGKVELIKTRSLVSISRLMILTAAASYLRLRSCSAFIITHSAKKAFSFQFSNRILSTRTMVTTSVNDDSSATYEFTDDERYLFDTFGFLIVRNVLNADEVKLANEAIDRHIDGIQERTDPVLRNTKNNTAFSGDGKRGRMDLGGVLEWGDDSKVFKSILAHPKLVPKFHALVGKGYRMDHIPFAIVQDKVS